MSRSLQQEYYPAPVPTKTEDLSRYLESEFMRIRESLIAQPVAVTVKETGTYTVTTIPVWEHLFIGTDATWDVPGGSWDPTTGIYTVPQSGLYTVDIQLEVAPYGSGNKNYYAGVAFVRDRGGVLDRTESTDGGDDDIPLGVGLSGMLPLLQGDEIWAEAAIVHEAFVGDADYKITMQILRVSS